MVMVQKIRDDQGTFAEVADSMMSMMVLHKKAVSQSVSPYTGMVFNLHRYNSIKDPEREIREAQKTAIDSETSRQTTRYISD